MTIPHTSEAGAEKGGERKDVLHLVPRWLQ
jgi:hypothetical protein